jgi:glutathione S-transferase
MRARLALWVSRIPCELREVKLSAKPPQLLDASRKGTVPVLVMQGGTVIEESLDIIRWALARNDPEGWLERDSPTLIEANDGPFKYHLDRYKYPNRYDGAPAEHRKAGLEILTRLEVRLKRHAQLCGAERGMADIAIFPFIRQFAATDPAWFNAMPLPRLRGWLKGHLRSNLFAAIMPKYAPWRPGDQPITFGGAD